jgi:putative transposase
VVEVDFTADTLADGRHFARLNIVDDFSANASRSRSSVVARPSRHALYLIRLHATVGLPQMLVVDNGPEFVGRTLRSWGYARWRPTLAFFRPGRPYENGVLESFQRQNFALNVLNEHWFVTSLSDAKAAIERGARLQQRAAT